MGDRQARVEIDVSGAERSAAAARAALQPWAEWANKAASAFSSFKSSVGQAVGGVVQDLGRVITVGSTISFAGAVSEVQSLEKATSQLAVATGNNFDAMRGRINALSEATGQSGEQIANFINNVGKATYSFSGAEKNLETFRKFALETGRDLTSTGGLAAGLKSMGVEDAAKAIDQLRANARSLGTVGGVAALSDQVTSLAGSFSKASNSSAELLALTAQLGKGLNPQQAAQVQQGVIGTLSSKAAMYEAHWHRTGALGKNEHIIDRATGKVDIIKAATLLQRDLKRLGPERGFRIGANELGSTQAASAFMALDLGKTGALAGGAAGTNALAAWNATPGGMEESDEARKAREMANMIGHGSTLGDAREWIRRTASGHPLAAALASGIPGVALGWLGKSAIPWLTGKGGAAAATNAVTTGVGLGFGGLATIAGGVLGGGLNVLGMGAATAPWNRARSQVEGEMGAQFATARAGQARAIIRAGERSGGTETGFLDQLGPGLLARAGLDASGGSDPRYKSSADPVLASIIGQLRSGSPELKNLPRDIAKEVASALKGSPLQIQVVNATGGEVSVNQPGGDQ